VTAAGFCVRRIPRALAFPGYIEAAITSEKLLEQEQSALPMRCFADRATNPGGDKCH